MTPLRKLLSVQSILVSLIPFVLLIGLGALWIVPLFLSDIESHQMQLATSVTSQLESFLESSSTMLRGIGYQAEQNNAYEDLEEVIESQLKASQLIRAIYLTDPSGHVLTVALKKHLLSHKIDLVGLDLSKSVMFHQVKEDGKAVWSDIFLSAIGGGLSVALTIPSKKFNVVGEIDLSLLVAYLEKIGTAKQEMIFVLDRKGQVIADQFGSFTAQQLNISNIPVVKKARSSDEASGFGTFSFNGKTVLGCLMKTRLIDWSVLVMTPTSIAYRPLFTSLKIICLVLLVTLLTGAGAAVWQARKIAAKFDQLAGYTRNLSQGIETGNPPHFTITEFKEFAGSLEQMATAIKTREHYNRLLFADSPIPLIVIDPESGKCLDANEAALRLFGMGSLDEMIEKAFLDFSTPFQQNGTESSTAAQKYYQACLENGFVAFEWRHQRPDRSVWYSDIAMSLFYHGKHQLIQLSIRDITHNIKAEEQRLKMEEQLKHAQKMESIGTLAGGIAHDFNNILFPISGYAEILIEELDQDSPLSKYAGMILKGAERAGDLVKQILSFSRQTEQELKPLMVDVVVKEALKLIVSTLPSTIEKHQDIKPCGLIMGDPGQIHQIVLNLCTNAFHAMENQNGRLSVTLSDVFLESGDLSGQVKRTGNYVQLTVTDTGQGMDKSIQSRIFNPYFTTKPMGKGTGLGLSLVHGIVEKHFGYITVYSEPGQGARFNVYFPVVESSLEKKQTSETSDIPTGNEHILIVDDEPMIVDMEQKVIEKLGYSVISFTNSNDALMAFQKAPEEVDLVVTDMTMPNLTGFQLAKKMKESRSDIPILLCTGFSEQLDIEKAKAAGIRGFLLKPVVKKDLAWMIRSILDNSQEDFLVKDSFKNQV